MLLFASIAVGVAISCLAYFLWGVNWYFLPLTFIGGFFLNCLTFFLSAGLVALLFGRKELTIKPKKIFNAYIVLCTKFLVTFFRIKIILIGEELLSDTDGFELISNHQSNFDPIIMISRFRRNNITFIMKKEIMNVPIVGRFLYSAAFYPLDRKSLREGYKTINYGSEAIDAGRAIGLFIEGTRSKGPDLGKFHDGALKMAMNVKKDIVISIVDNSYNIHRRFPFRRTKVLIKICKVFKYDEYKDLSTKELSQEIRTIMEDNLKESREKYNNYE